MKRTIALSLLLLGTLVMRGAWAAQPSQPPGLEPVPEPPAPPPPVQSGQALEPDVTIIHGEHRTITEYRVNGRLRAIKVEHEGYPTYYLVDTNGDGNLDTRTESIRGNLLVPAWVIFSW